MGEKGMEQIITTILGAGTGILVFIAGWPWQLLILYAILMTLDIITGILKAGKNGNWTSKQTKQGLFKKGTEVVFILSILFIQSVAISIGIPVPVGSIVVAAYCFKEFGSNMENYIELGGWVPEFIKKWFAVASETINKKAE